MNGARRLVVVGPYPPSPDPRADEVVALVRRSRAEGWRVDVVSPEPSAAAHHGRPGRVHGAWRIGRVARGADRVVLYGGGAGGPFAGPVLRRALAHVPEVEWVDATSWAGGRTRVSVVDGLARVRAGAPTFVRTVTGEIRSRVARARSARRGPRGQRRGSRGGSG